MLTVKQLEEMSRLEMDQIDRNQLADIQGLEIDPAMPLEARMESYLEQVKNPYCFLCGNTVIRVRFAPDGDTLQNKLEHFFVSLKKT